MSTYKAHIFKQRQVGEREEVKLKIFGPDGQPLDLTGGGGGGEALVFQGAAGLEGIENGGAFVPLVFDPPLPAYSPGTYMGRLEIDWGDLSGATSGDAIVWMVHRDTEGNPSGICEVRLTADYNGAYGDGPLDNDSRTTKIDFNTINKVGGTIEVWVAQYTDIHPLSVWVVAKLVKL